MGWHADPNGIWCEWREVKGLQALLLQRAQEIEQMKALLKTGADLLRRALVAEGSPFIAEAVAWLREPGVPGTSSATFIAAAALVSRAPQPEQEIQIAERIARQAHSGQKEESTGDDYIHHVERVVVMVEGNTAKAVAWLHDVLEDSDVTGADLVRAGISDDVREAVERLTRGNEPYSEYISTIRVCGPDLARVVKLADLRDHLRPNCPERLRPRYEKALAALTPTAAPLPASAALQALE